MKSSTFWFIPTKKILDIILGKHIVDFLAIFSKAYSFKTALTSLTWVITYQTISVYMSVRFLPVSSQLVVLALQSESRKK